MRSDYGGMNMDATRVTKLLMTKVWAMSWAYRDALPGLKLSEE